MPSSFAFHFVTCIDNYVNYVPSRAGMSCASKFLPCLSSQATTIWAKLKIVHCSLTIWPEEIANSPSVIRIKSEKLLKSKITSSPFFVSKQDVTLLWSFWKVAYLMPNSMYFAYYSRPGRHFEECCLFDDPIQSFCCECKPYWFHEVSLPFCKILLCLFSLNLLT